MDETTFDIDRSALAEASQRFPAQRLVPSEPRPDADVSFLAGGDGFAVTAWDESGH